MNKEKYLKELEKRLVYLTPEQKSTEIFRISNELDNNEIVKDLSQEVEEIYKKYKINLFKKEKNENNKFLKLLDKIGNYFQNFYKSFINYSTKDKALVIRDLIIIFLLISLFKIPFLVLENIIFSFFNNILSLNIIPPFLLESYPLKYQLSSYLQTHLHRDCLLYSFYGTHFDLLIIV